VRPELRQLTLPSGLTLELAQQGRGPAFLFLHGYTDSWRSFEPILPLLPEGVRALVPSQRGHGGSDRPEGDLGPAQLAEDAAALLDKVGVDGATVVGHSMGSLVAQALALAHPERVTHLVLVDSAARFDSPAVRELEQAVAELRDPISPGFVREFQLSTVHRPVPEALSTPRCARASGASASGRTPWRVCGRSTRSACWRGSGCPPPPLGRARRHRLRDHQERLRAAPVHLRVFPRRGTLRTGSSRKRSSRR
jgi:pimeloyl-ACP methyl ester carboxylesterase